MKAPSSYAAVVSSRSHRRPARKAVRRGVAGAADTDLGLYRDRARLRGRAGELFDLGRVRAARGRRREHHPDRDPHLGFHREDGPAVEGANGDNHWYKDGKHHREDGPAVEYTNGTKYWYKNEKLHREDGPAIECANGDKSWYLNGKLHREDGPAVERANGDKYWYLNGRLVTEEEFNIRNNIYCKIFKKNFATIRNSKCFK